MFARVLLILSIALVIGADEPRRVLDDASLGRLGREILDRLGTEDDVEVAAFVVRRPGSGAVALVHWPNQRRFRTAQWRGAVPEGVIAVIHTHPHRIPLPSPADAAEARKLGLPFYVVSRGALAVVHPDGAVERASVVPWLLRPRRSVVADLRWVVEPSLPS